MDWIFFALDHISRRATGCGNNSQTIFRLDRPLDLARLQNRWAEFGRWVPAVHGRCARAWNLAPYWAFNDGRGRSLAVTSRTAPDEAAALAILHEEVNRPFAGEHDHLRLVHVAAGSGALVSLVFDHRLLDARGALTLLRCFHDFDAGTLGWSEPFRPVRPSGLSDWAGKLNAGRRVNRRFRALAAGGGVRHLPVPAIRPGAKFFFRALAFDRAASARIFEHANTAAGYLMLAPYFLAASAAAFQEAFGPALAPGEHLLVPVNTDIRPRQAGLAELFFNHLSFLFLRFAAAEAVWTPAWIRRVTAVMVAEMSGGFARDLAAASHLFRIVPRRFLDAVQNRMMRARGQTFSFSYVQRGYEGGEFCGARVLDVRHTPRVAVHPGLGVYFTQYDQRLTVNLSCLEGLATPAQAEAFLDLLARRLEQPPAGGADA